MLGNATSKEVGTTVGNSEKGIRRKREKREKLEKGEKGEK